MSSVDGWLRIFSDVITIRLAHKQSIDHKLLAILRQLCKDGNIKIFRDPLGNPIGYAAWLCVNKESLIHIRFNLSIPPFHHEWNEGYLMVLYDVAYVPGWHKLAGDLFRDFIKSQRFVAIIRRSKLKIWTRFKNKYKYLIFTN